MTRWGIFSTFLTFLTLLTLSTFILCPQKSRAADPQPPPLSGVMLSEIMANPKGSDEDTKEFIELFNATDSPVDIAGWFLSVCDSKGCSGDKIIDFIGASDEGKYGFTTKIPSFGYALIVDPEYAGEYSAYFHQHYEWNFAMMTVESHTIGRGNIPNTAGTIKLSDGLSETSFTWTKNPGDGFSWEFDPNYNNWDPSGGYFGCSPGFDNQDPPKAKIVSKTYSGKAPLAINFQSESYDPEGSPLTYEWNFADGSQPSTIKSPKHTFAKPGNYEVVLYVWDALGLEEDSDIFEVTVYSPDIVISEVLPNPKGPDEGQEFIELFNKGNKTVNLSGWQLRDRGGAGITLENEKINPKSYRVFSGNFYLNNTGGEEVNLYFPDGQIKADTISFSNPQAGYSIALINNKDQWTYQPTPGKTNKFVPAPVASTFKNYSVSYQGSSWSPKGNSSYVSSFSKVKGITLAATDESLYPVGTDFRPSANQAGASAGVSRSAKIFLLTVIFLAVIFLIFDLLYPKIARQRMRGP